MVLMFASNGKNQVETLWERYSKFVSDALLGDPGNVFTDKSPRAKSALRVLLGLTDSDPMIAQQRPM